MEHELTPREDRVVSYLKKLREAANKICKEAHDNKAGSFYEEEAINWGDLHCCGVEQYINDYGETGDRAYIEEAAPNCCKFQAHIQDQLNEIGFHDIDVVTEW